MQFSRPLPYHYVAPAPRPWLARALTPCVRSRLLKRVLNVHETHTHGLDTLIDLQRRGHALVITANHPGHADGWSLICSFIPRGLSTYTLSEYAGLVDNRRSNILAMRWFGAYSINPYDFDPASFDTSLSILTGDDPRRSILFFPEGGVCMRNDTPDPFRPGAFLLAARAARQLQRRGSERRVFVAPIGLKFSFLRDARPAITAVVDAMQDELGLARDPLGGDPPAVLRRLGLALANHHLAQTDAGGQIAHLDDVPATAQRLLARAEAAMGLDPAEHATPADRATADRRAFYRHINTGAPWPDQPCVEQLLNLAERLLSYQPGYAAEHPTVDRIGDVVTQLYDDLHNRPLHLGVPRACELRCATPVDAADHALQPGSKKKAIAALAQEAHRLTAEQIDAANRDNDRPGAQLWNDAAPR